MMSIYSEHVEIKNHTVATKLCSFSLDSCSLFRIISEQKRLNLKGILRFRQPDEKIKVMQVYGTRVDPSQEQILAEIPMHKPLQFKHDIQSIEVSNVKVSKPLHDLLCKCYEAFAGCIFTKENNIGLGRSVKISNGKPVKDCVDVIFSNKDLTYFADLEKPDFTWESDDKENAWINIPFEMVRRIHSIIDEDMIYHIYFKRETEEDHLHNAVAVAIKYRNVTIYNDQNV